MIPLTRELAAAMLTVFERRQKDPRGTVYACTILEAAMFGKPDFEPELPNFINRRKADTDWLKK